jgi:hypothetical protein
MEMEMNHKWCGVPFCSRPSVGVIDWHGPIPACRECAEWLGLPLSALPKETPSV